jgi:Rad3-related DNA helicase
LRTLPPANTTPRSTAIFGAGGPLAPAVGSFKPRQSQTEMAKAIAHAIDNQGTLIAEAGTGTGKTFAYLVPALLWGGKTIISTGTKNLQDQLFSRDIPTVRAGPARAGLGGAAERAAPTTSATTTWSARCRTAA